VRLKGNVGEKIVQEVKITPQKEYPFSIVELKAQRGNDIQYRLEGKKNAKEYIITIENLKKDKGRYFDALILKTDSKIREEIKVNVYGYITDP